MSVMRKVAYVLAGLVLYAAFSLFGIGVCAANAQSRPQALADCTVFVYSITGPVNNPNHPDDRWNCQNFTFTVEESVTKAGFFQPCFVGSTCDTYGNFGPQYLYDRPPTCPANQQPDMRPGHEGQCIDEDKNLGTEGCQTLKTYCGNPINVATGNKYQRESDLTLTPLLAFTRHYNSHAAANSNMLGSQWTHTYTRSVEYSSAGAANPIAIVSRPEGNRVTFTLNAGVWTADADVVATLVRRDGAQGQLLGWTYTPQDGREVEDFDTLGRLMQISKADGSSISLTYNNGIIENNATDLRLTKVQAQDGRNLVFEYDTSSRISKITEPAGAIYLYSYDTASRLETVTYPDGAQRRYHYNESTYTSGVNLPYALTGITQEDNLRYATFKYAADGSAISTEHAGTVEKFAVQYNADGSSSIIEPLGQSQQRTFVTVLGLKKATSIVKSCAGCVTRTTSYTYDTNGRSDIDTDPLGTTTDYNYDRRGLLTQEIDAANDTTGKKRTTQTDWHPDFRVPKERSTLNAAGALIAKSTWTYNPRGQALTSAQLDPTTSTTRTTTTTYCEQANLIAGTCPLLGLVTSVDGPRTDVSDLTTYTYRMADEASCASAPTTCLYRKGDLWKVTNALNQVNETLQYDGAGRVRSVKDANGVITDLEYHPRGWLTARKVRGLDNAVETDDQVTRIDYWPTGLVKQVTQPDGAFTAYTYDAAHRLTDISDNAGNTIHYTLDNAGNRTQEDTKDNRSTLLRTLSRVYNQLGQLQTAKDALNRPTGFAYDANGNPDTVTDALTRVTDTDYDPLNRLQRTLQDVAGIAASTTFAYDALDNLTQVKDPKGLNTDYRYNGLSELTKLTSPDTGVTDYTYDSGGNRKTQVDARGITSTYTYDVLNRLRAVAYSNGDPGVTYGYDAPLSRTACIAVGVSPSFPVGRLTTITDASGSTLYCHDRFGNLVVKKQTVNGATQLVRYAYTLAGRVSSVTYPDGAIVDYLRDAQGRTTEVGVKPAGGTRQVLLTQATYYPYGPVAEWVYGNGRLMHRSLNLNYQPGFVEDGFAGGLSVGYEFDAVGNLAKLRKANQSDPPLRLFGYDGLNRLTSTKDGSTLGLLQGYGYDKTGNRTSATAGATTAYTYPSTSHRLDQVGAVARSYDLVGNTTAIGGTARGFTYNGAGRMSQVKANSVVTMAYTYNGKGEQVRKFLGTANTYTAYDEAGHWLGDYDTTGAPVQQAIWLDDLPVGLLVGAGAGQKLHYLEPDALGTPRVVIDPVRNVAVWSWDLVGEAFGNSAPNQNPDGDASSLVFNMRFPGQRYDAASGLNQNGFRDYDAATGRYPQSDPIGLNGGISTYGYVLGNPMIRIDPLGLACRQNWRNGREYEGPERRIPGAERKAFSNCFFLPAASPPGPVDFLPDPLEYAKGRFPFSVPFEIWRLCEDLYFRRTKVMKSRVRVTEYFDVCTDDCGNTTIKTPHAYINNADWQFGYNEDEFWTVFRLQKPSGETTWRGPVMQSNW